MTGRVTTGRAAATGAAQGAMYGLLFGLFFGTFFTSVWRALVQYAQRGRHDFGSLTETRADRYEVQVEDGVAGEAERLLERMPPVLAPR